MNKKILITGGAGFIGSYLSELLVKNGDSVIALDNYRTGNNSIDKVSYVKGDVRNLEDVRKIVENVDEVYHLAAAVGVRNCLEYPDYAFETNVIGTFNVLKCCLLYNKPLLFTSSSAVYGKIENKEVKESDDVKYGTTTKTEWSYSYQKAIEETMVSWYGKRGYPFKVVRIFNCVGIRQVGDFGMVVPRFVEWAKKNEPIVIYGDGEQKRTFGDVRDIVDGIYLVMQKGKEGEIYNVGGVEEITINQLANKIKKILKSKSKIIHVPYDKAVRVGFEETQQRKPSLEKIEKIGYIYNYNTDDTLKWIIK